MNNYYEMLGVSQGASASVVKIAYEGKMKALAKGGMPEAQRKAEERELEKAYVTLSNPAKRTWYDNQLEQRHARESGSGGSRGLIVGAVVVAVLASGIGWYFMDRSRTREGLRLEAERSKLEQERVAFEREKAEKAAELEQARLDQAAAAAPRRVEIRVLGDDRDQALRERAYSDSQSRAEQDAAFREEARKRVLQNNDRAVQQRQEDRDRRQADEDRRRAQAEVERQKQFVRQRELEEERARTERYNRVRAEDRERQRRETEEAARQRRQEADFRRR